MPGNWVGQSEMTLAGPVIEEQQAWSVVGRGHG